MGIGTGTMRTAAKELLQKLRANLASESTLSQIAHFRELLRMSWGTPRKLGTSEEELAEMEQYAHAYWVRECVMQLQHTFGGIPSFIGKNRTELLTEIAIHLRKSKLDPKSVGLTDAELAEVMSVTV